MRQRPVSLISKEGYSVTDSAYSSPPSLPPTSHVVTRRVNRLLILWLTIILIVLTVVGLRFTLRMFYRTSASWISAGQQAKEHGNLENAFRFYNQAIKLDKGNPEGYYQLATLYIKQDDAQSAMKYLQQLVDNHPAHKAGLLAILNLVAPDATLRLSPEFSSLVGRWTEQLLRVEPKNPLALRVQASLLFAQWSAEPEKNKTNLTLALKLAEESVAGDPKDARAVMLLALIYHRLEQSEKAQDLFNRFSQAVGNDPTGPLTYVSFLVNIGQLAQAKNELDNALKTHGNDPKVLFTAARLYEMTADKERARQVWEKLHEVQPQNIQPYAALATLAQSQGKYDETITLCNEGLEKIAAQKSGPSRVAPLRAELMLRRGMARAYQADKTNKTDPEREKLIAAAKEDCDAVILDRGEEVSSLVLAGQLSMLQGRRAEAITLFEKAQQRLPTGQMDIGLIMMLGQLYSSINQPGQALQLFREATAAAPTNPLPLQVSADLLLALNKPDEAEAFAKKLLELTPDDLQAKRLLISTVLAQGRQADAQNIIELLKMQNDPSIQNQLLAIRTRSGKPEERLSGYQALIANKPKDANLREQYLKFLMSRVPPDQVMKELHKAREDLPDAINLKMLEVNLTESASQERTAKLVELAKQMTEPFGRAMMLYTLTRNAGNIEEAGKYLAEAATIQPDNAQVMEEQLTLYTSRKEMELAEQVVKRAEKLNADGAEGAFYRGRLLSAQGKHPEAIAYFEIGLRKFPKSSTGLTAYGEALFRMGNTNEAVEYFNRALEQNPFNALALKGLAMALMPTNPNRAVRHAQQAMLLLPDDPWLQAVNEEARDILEPLDKRLTTRVERLRERPDDLPNVQALARLFFKLENPGDAAKGEVVLKNYLQRHPDSLPTVVQLCQRLIATRRGWQAEELLQQFLRQSRTPQDRQNALLMLARLYNDLKRYSDAEKAYAELVTQNTTDPALYAEFSECLAVQNKFDPALDQLRTAIALPTAQPKQYQALVRMLVENKKPDEAEEIIQELSQKFPKDEKLPWLRALLAISRHQPDEAIGHLSTVITKNPDDPLAIWQRAQLYSERGDMAIAIHDLETLKQINPRAFDFKPQLLLLDLLERTGEMVKAKLHATRLIDEASGNSELQLAIAIWLYRTGNYKEAESLIEAGTKANPTDWRWRLIKGQTYLVQNDLPKARDELIEAIRLNDQALTAITTLGEVWLKLEQPTQALLMLEQAKARKVDSAVCSSQRVIGYLMLGRLKEAEAEIHQNLVKIQRGEDLFTLVAQMLATVGEKTSHELIDEWIKKSTGTPLPLLVKASFLVSQGKIASALEVLNRIDKSIADDQELMVFYLRVQGIGQQQLKKYKDAEASYRTLLKLTPKDVVSLNNLAYMLANELNRPEEAIPLIQQARDIEPDNPNILDTQGVVMLKSGRLDDAERVLRMSLRLAEFPENRYHVGLLRMARKDWPGAKIELEKALQLLEAKNIRQEAIRNQIQDALEALK